MNEPRVLKGDPDRLQSVCDNMTQKNKYSSGFLSFEEVLTEEQKQEIIQSFEEHHFPGMDMSDVEILWVEHNDHDRTELNFIIAKVDEDSGKAMNPFPPGWQNYSDPWRDMINEEYGFSRPDDLKNIQTYELDYESKKWNQEFKNKLVGKKNIISEVTNFIIENSEDGKFESRDDVIKLLKQLEEVGVKVERESEKFISISAPDQDKNIRLKGAFYDTRNYNEDGYSLENPGPSQRTYAEREKEYGENCQRCNDDRAKRAKYNSEKFGASEPIHTIDVAAKLESFKSANSELDQSVEQVERISQNSNEKSAENIGAQVGETAEVGGSKAGKDENKKQAPDVGANNAGSSPARPSDHSGPVDLDAGVFVGTGSENESAQAKDGRFQSWIETADRAEQKIISAAKKADEKLRVLKNESAKKIISIAENITRFTARVIPFARGINKKLNDQQRKSDEFKQSVDEFSARVGKTNDSHRTREFQLTSDFESNRSVQYAYHEKNRADIRALAEAAKVGGSTYELADKIGRGNTINEAIELTGILSESLGSANSKIGEIEKRREAEQIKILEETNPLASFYTAKRLYEKNNAVKKQPEKKLPAYQQQHYIDSTPTPTPFD